MQSHEPTFAVRTIFQDQSLEQLISEWQPIEVPDLYSAEFNFPPAYFIDWVRLLPRIDFDGCPRGEGHKTDVSFLATQIHRHWITANLLSPLLQGGKTFVDLGSYPFSVPIVLRGFCRLHDARILATAIQPISEAGYAALRSYRIETARVDLDPHVVGNPEDEAPARVPLDDGVADVVMLGHVIEHLYHPMDILREARRILRPGGHLVISTDNAMQIETLLNILGGREFLHEPVQNTAAMLINSWRGHCRFFTPTDLINMTKATGFTQHAIRFEELFFNTFAEDLFHAARPTLQKFKIELLTKYPQLRNDLFLVAT